MSSISFSLLLAGMGDYLAQPSGPPFSLSEIASTIGMPAPVSCLGLGTLIAGARTLQVLADTPPDNEGATWTADILVGHQWLGDPNGPEFAWVQVESPSDEYDTPLVAVTGAVIDPQVSTSDFPFHHPFGNDWECYVDVDPKFRGLLSPVNGASGEPDYAAAAQQAPYAPESGSHQGVLGIEWDAQLVPTGFQPAAGERVALFGRWILDAGHNFHTEMHPPLLMVRAAAPLTLPDGGLWTQATITSRPYLVSEAWPEGSFRNHLIAEIEKVAGFQSFRLEAHPTVWSLPFTGSPSMTMFLRTSTAPPAGKTLQVQYALTARSGVIVAMTPAPPDGVQITVETDPSYQAGPLPPKTEISISLDDLAGEAGLPQGSVTIGDVITLVVTYMTSFLGFAYDAYVSAIVNRGIKTDSYTLPANWQPSGLTTLTTVDVADLGGPMPVTQDDDQPYPVYGWINVGWN